MAFPTMEVLGLASNALGSYFQQKESRKRFKAMRNAARAIEARRANEFNTSLIGLRGAQTAWENDPARATLRKMWEAKLANPNVVSQGDLSVMKQGALSNAGSESAGAINRLREQQQRSGMGGSRMALGAEAGLRSGAFGKAAGISSGLDLEANRLNTEATDKARSGYADYAHDENDTRTGYAKMIADLYGSRQDGETALLAAM